MRLNFADVGEPEAFELMPNGKYHSTITAMEVTETGDNPKAKNPPGTPMIKVEFTVASGQYENRKVWTNIVLAGDSLKILKSLLYALGWSQEEVDDDDFQFDPEETGLGDNLMPLVGMELDVKIGRRAAVGDYDAQNTVKQFYPHMTSNEEAFA